MKKNFKYYIAVWAVLVLLFHVIVFAIPSDIGGVSRYTETFWVGYAAILASFLGQLGCAFYAFKPEKIEKVFLNLPIITESYAALVSTFAAGAVCIRVPFLPTWVGVIICVTALGFSVISVIMAAAAGTLVSESETEIKEKTSFMKLLTVDADALMSQAKTPKAKAACKKVWEVVRYSDPMSNETLSAVEAEISEKFLELKAAVAENAENISEAAEELLLLIDERNKKCKALK